MWNQFVKTKNKRINIFLRSLIHQNQKQMHFHFEKKNSELNNKTSSEFICLENYEIFVIFIFIASV